MKYAIIKDEEVIELNGVFTDANNIQHPESVLRLWTEDALEDIGVLKIVDVRPTSIEFNVTGSHLELIDGVPTRVYDTVPVDLSVERNARKIYIDGLAEQERLKHLTAGSGQAMTYQQKASEAIRYQMDGNEGDYPMLESEVGITADTLEEVAGIVLDMHNGWLFMGAKIEKARLAAKDAIDKASTVAAIRAITFELDLE